jgi:hypothetical protein
LRQTTGSGSRTEYESALEGLWRNLGGTLTRLESGPGWPAPRLLDDDTAALLPTLQYSLHAAGELAVGLDPPDGTEAAHADFGSALAEAREATAELLEALETAGIHAAEPLVYEWRGALFQVRLAWQRLLAFPAAAGEPADEAPRTRRSPALIGTAAALAGAIALATGAALTLWPVWGLGLALVALSLAVQRH